MTPEWVLSAFDSLNMGILVCSTDAKVCCYNEVFGRLRGIGPDEMIGHPVEEVYSRRRLRMLLQSAPPPREEPTLSERRKHRDVLVPIQQDGVLLGGVVVVQPVSNDLPKKTRSPAPANVGGESNWPYQYTLADIIGRSPEILRARELALQAAQAGSSVLLTGESGTGKELFAHAIHSASSRRDFPFVPVDCSAIPSELLEAELFGYAPGAFTGASKRGKPGKFELAHGGTIFLDEIGEMPLEMQAKLLRVLQERRIVPVGGVTSKPVDFTVIAATSRDLESMVAQGRFRRDLFYRLDVIRIVIPSLRERPEDIPLLIEHYWQRKSKELGKEAKLSPGALQVLEMYSWPGNIRELLNLLERVLVGVTKSVIEPRDLPMELAQDLGGPSAYFPRFHLPTILAEAERQTLDRALRQAHGNRRKASELVGLPRATFYRKLKSYGLIRGGHG
jgi:transcriptional regulator with PAS, ATPase and Fis domain